MAACLVVFYTTRHVTINERFFLNYFNKEKPSSLKMILGSKHVGAILYDLM